MGNICFKSPPRLHVADSSPINVKGNNDSNPIKADLDTTSQMPNNAIDGCETPLITSVSNHKHQHKTDYAHDIHQNLVKMLIPKKIKSYIPFLATSWPGSILNWSKDDIETFASCFTVRHHNEGEEIPLTDLKAFFIVAEGMVEIHAILPTKCKKTMNIREFLCKKAVGDMVNIRSIYKLISESNAEDIYKQENIRHEEHVGHKNILDVVDTVSIQSVANSTILLLDWACFEEHFTIGATSIECGIPGGKEMIKGNALSNSGLDVKMLRTIMETNLTDYLKTIPIFKGLPYSKLELLSRLCKYSIEKEGSIIFREGDIGEDVFILLSGEVKVEAMASKRMVELFEEGVLSLLQGNKDGYSRSSNSLSSSVNKQIKYPEPTREPKLLSNVQYDQTLIANKASSGRTTLISRRKTLLRARGDYCREIAKGTTSSFSCSTTPIQPPPPPGECPYRLDIPDPTHSVELARFHSGDYFGEISTFIGLPRVATVTATTNTLMVSLSNTSFRTLYHVISPHLEVSVENIVKEHMLHTLLHSKSPFLEVISVQHAKRMSEVSSIIKLDKDDIVFHEGDEADKFYFVYSGCLSVDKRREEKNEEGEGKEGGRDLKENKGSRKNAQQQDSVRIGSLYAGDYFGEMALIDESKRRATIACQQETVLMGITRDNFHECFKQTPQLVAELVVRMKGRNVDLCPILSYNKSRNAFMEYLDLEGNTPNYLHCYDDIYKYEAGMEEASKDNRMADALGIVQKYFRKGGSQSVDLPVDLVNGVKARLTEAQQDDADGSISQVMDSKIFSSVKEYLYCMMNEWILPKFKQNQVFDVLMNRMRAYDDFDVKMLA